MPKPAGSGGISHPLFVSKDRRIPKIRIQTRQLENLLDKRIVVAVDSWDRLSRYPSGHYVRTIGEIGDRDTETEVHNKGFFLFLLLFFFQCPLSTLFLLWKKLVETILFMRPYISIKV